MSSSSSSAISLASSRSCASLSLRSSADSRFWMRMIGNGFGDNNVSFQFQSYYLVVRLGREPHCLQWVIVIWKICDGQNIQQPTGSTLTEWLCRSRQNSILWLKAICGSLNWKKYHFMQECDLNTWCCKRRWCPWTAWCQIHDQAPLLSHHLWSPWMFDLIWL